MSASRRALCPRSRGLALAAFAGWLAAAGPAAGAGIQPLTETLAVVGPQRDERGAEPLRIVDALERAALAKARSLAAEVADFPSLRPEHVTAGASLDDLPDHLRAAGFEPRRARAHVIVADQPITGSDLVDREPGLIADLLDPELREVGLAVVHQGRLEIAVAIVALSKQLDFEILTRDLRDLDRALDELLTLTNQARRGRQRPPLRIDRCLQRVAQRYADRMLEEGFYGHYSPEGHDAGFRARGAGCRRRKLAENLARGQYAPLMAVEAWMDSPGHRENLLDPDFRRVGFGVALGRRDDEYWILWVQLLGSD